MKNRYSGASPGVTPSPFVRGVTICCELQPSRSARGERLRRIRRAAAFRFGDDRPVRDIRDRFAVFRGLDQAAFKTQRFDPRTVLFRRRDQLPRAPIQHPRSARQRRQRPQRIRAFRLPISVPGDQPVVVGAVRAQPFDLDRRTLTSLNPAGSSSQRGFRARRGMFDTVFGAVLERVGRGKAVRVDPSRPVQPIRPSR